MLGKPLKSRYSVGHILKKIYSDGNAKYDHFQMLPKIDLKRDLLCNE